MKELFHYKIHILVVFYIWITLFKSNITSKTITTLFYMWSLAHVLRGLHFIFVKDSLKKKIDVHHSGHHICLKHCTCIAVHFYLGINAFRNKFLDVFLGADKICIILFLKPEYQIMLSFCVLFVFLVFVMQK